MKKIYKSIVLTYIALHLSPVIGVPITSLFFEGQGTQDEVQFKAYTTWLVLSFSATLIITLFLLRKEYFSSNRKAIPLAQTIIWIILGVFLAFAAQILAVQIEKLFGVTPGSENTREIISMIEVAPQVILVSSVIAPILEEIVFRKIIFGTLHKEVNFWIAALISSLIFSVAHFELNHILLYASLGLTFAFLYVKTNQILVPIMTHILMNSIVVFLQVTNGHANSINDGNIIGMIESFLFNMISIFKISIFGGY